MHRLRLRQPLVLQYVSSYIGLACFAVVDARLTFEELVYQMAPMQPAVLIAGAYETEPVGICRILLIHVSLLFLVHYKASICATLHVCSRASKSNSAGMPLQEQLCSICSGPSGSFNELLLPNSERPDLSGG